MITENFPNDGNENVCLYSNQSEYIQTGDTWSNGELQTLKLKTEYCADSKYFVMETTRWAFDNIEDLIEILKDFKKRSIVEN